jgi:DNA-binding transcriptional LysR family regulator
MGAWASAEYLAAHGEPSLARLGEHLFIDGLSTRGFAVAMERLGYGIPDGQVAFRTDSLQCQRRAAELGWGIVGIPDYMARAGNGLIRVLGDVPESVHLEIWLVARPAVRQQQLLRIVFDALAEGLSARFGDPPPAQGMAAELARSKSTSSLSA